jgi:hypothetical protein
MSTKKLPCVQDMPLSQISVQREQKQWLDGYFVDIAKRNAASGNIHLMMLEAYVLGMHHTIVASKKGGE